MIASTTTTTSSFIFTSVFYPFHGEHFETIKEFLVELMNRLHSFITQPIDWLYNGLDESIFFFLVLSLEKTPFRLVFVHYSVTKVRYF